MRFHDCDQIRHDRAGHRHEHGQRHALPAQVAAHGGGQACIHPPGHDCHHQRAQQRAHKRPADVRPLTERFAQENVVHGADDKIARERSDRRAGDIQLRHCDQKPVDRDLRKAPGQHGIDRIDLMPGRLQDRCGNQRNAHKHRRNAQQHQQRGTDRVAARIEHVDDRVRQHGKADAHRHGNCRGDAQRGLRNGF